MTAEPKKRINYFYDRK